MVRANTIDDFHKWYIPEPMSGCWLWVGYSPNGRYGSFKFRGERILAHVASYIIHLGDLEKDAVVDHLCRNGFCVNPAHLEAKTQLDNMRRQPSALKTHCRHGHSYADGVEIYIRPTPGQGRQFRRCLTCYPKKPRLAKEAANGER